MPALAADLVRLKVDVLVATGVPAISAAIGASRTTPIVGVDLEGDPVESGFVASFARPGGNVTGLFMDQPALTGKLLDLLREVAPGTQHIAVLWDSTTGPYQVRALKAAAQSLALEVQLLEFRRPAEIEVVLRQVTRGRPRALIALSSPLMSGISKRVAEFGVRNRLPVISLNRVSTADGGPDELWARSPAVLSSNRHVRGQDSERRQACRSPRRAADDVQAGDQSQDREGPRPHDPPVGARAGGRDHPIVDRRALIAGILGFLAMPLAAKAQPAGKVTGSGSCEPARAANADMTNAFSQGLRELGYVEGQNVAIEYRWAEGKYERFPDSWPNWCA